MTEQDLTESLGLLCGLSLVRADSSATAYSMHKLVQGAAQELLVRLGIEQAANVAATALLHLWRSDHKIRDHYREQQLIPHVQTIVATFDCPPLNPLTRARLLTLLGTSPIRPGRYSDAQRFLRMAYDWYSSSEAAGQFDNDELTTAACTLASTLSNDDKEGQGIFRSLLSSEKESNTPNSKTYLEIAILFANFSSGRSLAHSEEAETVLLRAVEPYRVTLAAFDEDDITPKQAQQMRAKFLWAHGTLAYVLLERYRRWESWRVDVKLARKTRSRNETLCLLRDVALHANHEVQKLAAIDLYSCEACLLCLGVFAEVLTIIGRYTEAESAARHTLCLMVKNPGRGEAHHETLRFLGFVNHIRELQQQPAETLEGFLQQHARCTLAIHGCQFYAAELD